MAQLDVKVVVDKQSALEEIGQLEQKIQELEGNPINLKVNINGGNGNEFDGLQQSQERATQGVYTYTAAQSKAADATDKTAQSGKRAVSVFGTLGDKASAYMQISAMSWGENAIRASVTELKKLDSAMVDVRKVTGATADEMEALKKQSYEMAQTYGVMPSDFMGAVADFSRAGYRETADELAELQIKTQLVGDTNAEVAGQFLLATDAAYGYEGSITQLSAVLDGMNAIDNNFATSIEKMSAGFGKVAPIAAQAHVGVDELAAAIGTITAVTQRSGEEAATALRALFLNIMGDTKTEIEDGATWTAGEIDGLRAILERYAPAAVAAAEATGQVINPMEAMRGLAQSMREGILTEQELMQMVTDIGGKLRSSQLLAIVQNWDMYESMLSTYQMAVGSADQEVETMTDSWEVKSNQLAASANKLLSSFFDSEDAKGGLDFLNTLVQGMDSGFGQAVIQAGLLSVAATTAYEAFNKMRTLFSQPMDTTGWIGLAVAGLSLLVSALQEMFPSYEKLEERAAQSQAAYEAEGKKLETLAGQIAGVQQQITTLQNMGPLNLVQQEQLTALEDYAKLLTQMEDVQKRVTQAALEDASIDALHQMRALDNYNADAVAELIAVNSQTGNTFGLATADLQNVNNLIAALHVLKETREEAFQAGDDATFLSTNDAVSEVERSIWANVADITNFLATFDSYYDGLIQKSQETGQVLTTDQAAFVQEYEAKARTLEGIYKEVDPAKYAEYYVELAPDAARAKVDEYTGALEKQAKALADMAGAAEEGSYEQKAYQDQLDEVTKAQEAFGSAVQEAQKQIGEVGGTQDAIRMAEELAGTYELTQDATDALVQAIRLMADEAKEAGKETARSFEKINVKDVISDMAKAKKPFAEIKKEIEDLRKAAKRGEIVLEADTDDLDDAIQKAIDEVEDVTNDGDYTAEVDGDASQAEQEVDNLETKLTDLTGKTWTVNIQLNTTGQMPNADVLVGSNASGTSYADAGPTLVNELGPELIVSKEQKRAYIAGSGGPTITVLGEGDIVYTAEETKQLLGGSGLSAKLESSMGIPSRAYAVDAGTASGATLNRIDGSSGSDGSSSGSGSGSMNAGSVSGVDASNKLDGTSTSQSSGGGGSGGGSGGGGRSKDDTDYWGVVEDWFNYYTNLQQIAIDTLALQLDTLDYELEGILHPLEETIEDYERLSKAIDRQIELLERQRKAMIDPIQDEIDALEKAKDIEDEQLELAEKKQAVEEARAELQNAQNERNIRYFNAEKGQWEWMADQGRVADAQEAVEDAEKDLADFEYEMYIRSLEREIEHIEDVFDEKIEELEAEQLVYDDQIYDLEQKVDQITDKYEDQMYPIEREQGKLELELQKTELEWANAELPYIKPEDDLNTALGKIGGTSSELEAVKDALENAESMGNSSYDSIGSGGTSGSKKGSGKRGGSSSSDVVKVTTPQTTAEMYEALLTEMGIRFGASEKAETGSTNVSSSTTSSYVDNSGQTIINGLTVQSDADNVPLKDMLGDVGIYTKKRGR